MQTTSPDRAIAERDGTPMIDAAVFTNRDGRWLFARLDAKVPAIDAHLESITSTE